MGNAAAVAQAQVEYDADHIKSVVKDHVDTFEGEKISKKDLAAKIAAHDGNDLDEDKALQILNAHYGEEEEVEKEKVQNWIVPVFVSNDTAESAPAAEGEGAAPAEGEEAAPAEGEAAASGEGEAAASGEGEAAAPAEGEAAAAPAEGEAAAPAEGEAAAPAEGEAAAPAEGEAAAPAEGEAAAPAEGEAAADGETASVQG